MLEKEIKIMLSKEQYESAEKIFAWERQFRQVNFYYGDLYGIGENRKLTVRVRQNGDDYRLQIKKPVSYDKSLHIQEEYEEKLKQLPEKISGEQLKSILNEDFFDYHLLGKLETLRKVFQPSESVEISLDISSYFDKTDYEIEIEFRGEMPYDILSLLEDMGIRPKESTEGKFARFMREYLLKHRA